MQPALARQLHHVFLAKGVHATTAIEGNTLSEEQVRLRVQKKLELPKSQEYLGKEVDNIVHAMDVILPRVIVGDDCDIGPREICEFNALVLDGLDIEPEVAPGIVRSHEVGVGSYSGAPAQDCDYSLERLCDWLNEPVFRPSDDMLVPLSIVRAVVAHLYLAWIHPFGDGNGRTARLVEFKIMVAAGVPTAAAHLLSSHYNLTRSEYYRQLSRASRSADGVLSFLFYAIQGFVDGLRLQLEPVWEQQWDLAWRDYVHEVLRGDGKAERRQRHLVLDLADHAEPIPLARIRGTSTRVTEDYANLSAKTLSRDLKHLLSSELLLLDKSGFAANRELIQTFRPPRRRTSELTE